MQKIIDAFKKIGANAVINLYKPGVSLRNGRGFRISIREDRKKHASCFELEVQGNRFPIIGNVCMDMCMLDASSLPADVKIPKESEVLIFGKEKMADELASYLGTINYEITCVVGKRVQRIYVEDGKIR